MIFLPKSAKMDIPEAGLEIIYRRIERFVRAGGVLTLSEYGMLDDVEVEAFVQARRVYDFERALIQERIGRGTSEEDILRVIDPPAAAKLATENALKAMATRMNTAAFAKEARP